MNRTNNKGNAALVAVLIMIIIIGISAIVLILVGRNSIEDNNDNPQVKNTTANVATTQQTQAVPEEPKELDLYPKQASEFKETNIKDFTADASILVDFDDDTVLAGKNMDKRIFPASLTKVMTILVAAENLKSYDDTYTFKDSDFTKIREENASVAGFKPGEKVTAKDLMYAAILPSGADACVGLENLVAGSEAAFVKMMNDRAKELGLKNTNFVNSSGLHHKDHYSSVNDIAVIMKVANHNMTCRTVMSTTDYVTAKTTQNPNGIKLPCTLNGRINGFYIDKNGNGTSDDSARITGGKTGFTDEAKATIATVAKDSDTGHTYCCVLAKCKDALTSASETMSMYEKYLPGSKAKIADATPAATAATTTAATTKAA